ncbi:MAG TPA: GDSL-type esterase/lipase family protein, partial [Lacipirellulaceae bacterium]|nr:GDSL-type esterase/lipase family protein [Lacipirellulaceae bacterium]
MAELNELGGAASNRRDFVRASLGLGAAGVVAFGAIDKLLAAEESTAQPKQPIVKPGDVVLFQGDSITDMGRKRDISEPNDQAALGAGYPWFAASQMLVDMPEAGLKIFNRGVSGNKVYQLAERWQADCLDLKPNVLSILIGVNDYWHKHKHNYEGTL